MSGFFRVIVFLILVTLSVKSPAQYVDFGRNKVQYNNFDWYTLSTEHFKIYFYPEMRELAEIGAAYAEESYRIHQQNFNFSLIDTVPLIFYSTGMHFRETNTVPGLIPEGVGGFFEFIKGRVVIPFDGSLGNFKHVIRHELCHVFMTFKVSNVLRAHRQSADRQPPLWFTEGLAEFWSNEWDAVAEMVIKDAVLNGYMAGLSDWENFFGTFFMYKMGQNALMFLHEKYGKEKILMLMENMWVSDDFSAVMEMTLGDDYEAFDKKWLYQLKKTYFPDIISEDFPSMNTEPVFTEGFGHKPAYYRDGETEEIYFIANRSGYTSIYKINLKGDKKPQLIIEGESSEDFEEFHFFRTGLDISSRGILAFATKRGGRDVLHLYDIKKEKLISSLSFKGLVQIGSPSFSAEGDNMVFPAIDMGGRSDLFIYEIDSNKLTRLTNDYYDDRDPDFSPDGKKIVFSSDRTAFGSANKYNLFLYDTETNSISYLTCGNQVDYSPQFSSDGKKIIFTSSASDNIQNIWYIDLDPADIEGKGESFPQTGHKVKRLTSFTTAAFDPRWIDNNNIVFSSYEKGTINVMMLRNMANVLDSSVVLRNEVFDRVKDFWYAGNVKSISRKNELKYKKEYSLDVAMSNISTDPVFGTRAGGILALSDLLGNDRYYFLVFNNSETGDDFFKSFNIAVSRVSLERRLNYAYGVFHLSGVKYDYGDDFPYYERSFGGYFALSYPLSFFKRVDASISLSNSKRDVTEEGINRRALLLTNSIAYVKDNSIWGPTGPLDGSRFNLTLSYTTDIQNSRVNYYSILFDYRQYLRISNSVAVASRIEFLMNQGKEARRWVMGGSWDLRGYPRFSIRGRKLWLSSTELRFPLVNLFLVQFPLGLDFYFPYIRGAVFFDAGNAWDEDYEKTLGSIGVGARMNLFGVLALRYDFGKRIESNFNTFQDDYFHQFFFGWDF